MMARRTAMGLLGSAGVAGLAGCSLFRQRWKYRYRLTVQVGRDGETYASSSVIEVVRTEAYNAILGEAKGEAVAVDVPGSGTLFALLRGKPGDADWAFTMPHYAFEAQLGSVAMVDRAILDKLEQMQGVKVDLKPEHYPMLVRFRDINDPTTVQLADPTDLAASFGSGVTLKRITVEVTDEAVTTGIGKRLGWLETQTGTLVRRPANVPLGDMRPEQRVIATDFKQGNSK